MFALFAVMFYHLVKSVCTLRDLGTRMHLCVADRHHSTCRFFSCTARSLPSLFSDGQNGRCDVCVPGAYHLPGDKIFCLSCKPINNCQARYNCTAETADVTSDQCPPGVCVEGHFNTPDDLAYVPLEVLGGKTKTKMSRILGLRTSFAHLGCSLKCCDPFLACNPACGCAQNTTPPRSAMRRCRPFTEFGDKCVVPGAKGTPTSDNVCTQCADQWYGQQCQLASVVLAVKYEDGPPFFFSSVFVFLGRMICCCNLGKVCGPVVRPAVPAGVSRPCRKV